MKVVIDDCRLEKMDSYTEPLEAKIRRQAAQITRLLAENAELKGLNSTICDVCKNDEFLKETAEQARAKGQEEAWKLALELRYMDYEDKVECFDLEYDGKEKLVETMEKYTYAEAAAKVAEWERKKEEICVRDIVSVRNANICGVVTYKDTTDNTMDVITPTEGTIFVGKEDCKKTGRHIDITSMLAQIGGGSDETEN